MQRVAASANDAESNTSYSEDRAIEEDAVGQWGTR